MCVSSFEGVRTGVRGRASLQGTQGLARLLAITIVDAASQGGLGSAQTARLDHKAPLSRPPPPPVTLPVLACQAIQKVRGWPPSTCEPWPSKGPQSTATVTRGAVATTAAESEGQHLRVTFEVPRKDPSCRMQPRLRVPKELGTQGPRDDGVGAAYGSRKPAGCSGAPFAKGLGVHGQQQRCRCRVQCI